MNELINPIWPGFTYALDLELDGEDIAPGAVLRIALSIASASPRPPVSVTLSRPAPRLHRLSITAEQTKEFRAPGMAWGDFVLRRANGTERPLNLQIGIPVERSMTAPLP